jgi:(heptosyl)LPS beta-1,4-glucosyltransferase
VARLSVTVITKNEERDLAAALESVRWADEIVVVDCGSTDRTGEIARRYTDRVFVEPWQGFVAQKNFAASMTRHDWVLSLDADERVTPELAASIRAVLENPTHGAYRCSRVTWHLGQWIRSTDWYPDSQVRLYDKRNAGWSGRHVHEALIARGTIGSLTGELQHYAYRDIADHLETIDRYTTLAAIQMHEQGRRAGLLQIAAHPLLAFARNYVLRGGFKDGRTGFIISAMNAYYVFLKFAKTWELTNRQGTVASGEPSTAGAADARVDAPSSRSA